MENEVSPIAIVDLEDDHHLSSFITPISCRGSSKITAISVEQYTDARDLHLSIMASLLPTRLPTVINLDDYDDDDEVQVLSFKPSRKKPISYPSVVEIGQSSKSQSHTPLPPSPEPFMCEICVEPKPMKECFKIEGCTHFYCTDCMIKYVASKLQDNITSIQCPVSNCRGLLEPEYCRPILPLEVFERWGNALCESVLLASEKFYCPFKDCSALLLHDGDGGEVITQSECPYCRRLFCAKCKCSWHSEISCEEFQNLNKDEREREDIMMMQLAKSKKWKRCPKCRFYVEKSNGCMYMKCRCGFAFCYNCGAASTSNSHLCSKCKH